MSKKNLLAMRAHDAKIISEIEDIKRLTAKDAMIKPVFVYPDDDPKTIIGKLKKENINVCIVVTRDKEFIGEISDADLVRIFLQQTLEEPLIESLDIGYMRGLSFKKAEDLINKHRSFVDPKTPIVEVIRLIYKEDFNYIPIIEKGKVKGVVTPSSLLNLLQHH